LPANEHQAFCWIKYSVPVAVEATAAKRFLRSPRRHFRIDRSPIGQSPVGHPEKVENVIKVQEHPEHVRAANDANAVVWRPEHSQGLLDQ
jgi:hypothetical protein